MTIRATLTLKLGVMCAAVCATSAFAQRPVAGGSSSVQLPEGPGKDVVQKVCGSTCHGPDIIMGKGRTRDQWTAVVNTMVGRGAKASESELVQISEYLGSHFGPNMVVSPPPAGRGGRPAVPVPASGRGPGPLGAGAADSHVVDEAGAERGKTIYIAECITCHGNKARGSDTGPDLVRSLTVLHDRYGSTIGAFLLKGHTMQSGRPSTALTAANIADLSHFLHQRVYDTLRSGPYSRVINVLTGDAKAGQAYFNGAGRCNSCHSPTGDLAGIARKYDPPTLQQRCLFPQTIGFGRGRGTSRTKPVMVTVTPASGAAVSGMLVHLDDFNVALRDAAGEYHSWKRTPDLKVVQEDPYAAHVALLDEYTDKNIHDLVAYLETLK